jgi:AAA domain-containing protein
MPRRPKAPIDEIEQVSLPARLDEFRTALEEEIKAAQRGSSNVVLLTAGRFVAMVAGEFLYEFETASPVRVPPDTPGELIIDGRDTPVPITVVSIEELTVTMASVANLGRAIGNAKLRTNLTMLLRRLIDRIEQKAEQTWPAAERLLDGHPAAGKPIPLHSLKDLDGKSLNAEQHSAVESALGRNLTFIWGPPGTGKTQTIGSIGRELFTRHRTLLLVSHTNVAVDEALHRIASLCAGSFAEGEIIRIGEPVKAEMQQRTDLICHHIAAKRSEVLRQQRATLGVERRTGLADLKELQRLTTVVEWASEAPEDICAFRDASIEILRLETEAVDIGKELSKAEEEKPLWEDRRRAAADAQLCIDQRANLARAMSEIGERRTAQTGELLRIRKAQEEAERILAFAREAEPLRQRKAVLPVLDVLQHEEEKTAQVEKAWANACSERERALSNDMALLQQAESMGKIRRLWRRLPDPVEQAQVVAQASLELEVARQALQQAGIAKADAEARRQESEQLGTQLERFSHVPPLTQQEKVCTKLAALEATTLSMIADCDEHLRQGEAALSRCDEQLRAFRETYGVGLDELIQHMDAFNTRLEELFERQQAVRVSAGRKKKELDSQMRGLLVVLRQVCLSDTDDSSLAEMLAAIELAHAHAIEVARKHPYEQLTAERNRLSSRIASIDAEIEAVDDQLSHVEQDIILNARVIATTLTRAFMRDVLQQRQFDTVLCDEVSMAPIPALWAAATLAAESVVVVGDFLQLPPIVQSEHAIAKKWLGRDVFEVSGVQRAYERKKPAAFFVALKRQFRMHPAISDAPNYLVYGGNLIDEEWVSKPEADDKLLSWYQKEWGLDRPLLMVDTSEAGGWNNKSGNSRLNFLSATLAVRIANAVLCSSRPAWEPRDGRRIFIITPYRPQAALINLLLQDEGIVGEVQASTAHSCQGGEAQLVILDLVVDEPHYATSLTSTAAGSDIRRLLNVAMTRAKRRLVVLGNFEWLQRKGRGGFVGGELLPYLLKKYQSTAAAEVVAATATTGKTRTIQAVEVPEELDRLVGIAKKQLILMSPSVSASALATLMPNLCAACLRGVNLLLVIRPLPEDGAHAESEQTEIKDQIRQLRDVGAAVIFKSAMREKFALVDGRVVWTGTFSLLTTNRDGVVEERGLITAPRRLRLYEEVMDCLGLEQVFSAIGEGQLECPVCAADMWMADTSPKSDQPFYWRCSRKGCYSRSLTEPPVVAGMIAFACGGRPSLNYRGNDPIWVCDCGKRHRCRIKKAHLCLPKMWALVPRQRRNRLLRELGITSEDFLEVFCRTLEAL